MIVLVDCGKSYNYIIRRSQKEVAMRENRGARDGILMSHVDF